MTMQVSYSPTQGVFVIDRLDVDGCAIASMALTEDEALAMAHHIKTISDGLTQGRVRTIPRLAGGPL